MSTAARQIRRFRGMVYDRQRTKRSFDCEKKIAAFEWSVMYEHGSPRIHAVLQFRGIACSKNTVAKLMREAGIRAKAARKYRCTTDSNHSLPVAENLVQREFLPDAPNLIWAGDITEIPTREGKLYLAVILDLYSRLVVGWSVGSTMETELAVAAFRMASRRRRITRELILHSDRGSASILARVSNRNRMSPDGRNVDIGVRPAGAID